MKTLGHKISKPTITELTVQTIVVLVFLNKLVPLRNQIKKLVEKKLIEVYQ